MNITPPIRFNQSRTLGLRFAQSASDLALPRFVCWAQTLPDLDESTGLDLNFLETLNAATGGWLENSESDFANNEQMLAFIDAVLGAIEEA